ncbi:protein SCAI-like [Chenopodium quinoa]|uniref:protein SCAI-like n=1 Tax=Chenopodium quinoa TaxID=63459 RepID=UPI000B784AE9|nr:protein SCAI-like [Chenopodium quinoa]XP_021735546.1 protein SCAI-like [Chenopodium quinoa]
MAQQNSGIPTIEIYWSLVDKADKKFAKIRDLPLYERNRFDTYFCKVFKVYTELWKFQQANRQKLVDGGLKRWEIGEIASRIGQLYFGQYTRTSDASYLSESYVFYEALLAREYFKEGMFQDINLAHKQLRFIARFITVCLVLNRRHMVHQLVNHLKILLDECKRAFQEANFREWKVVVQEVAKFLKADTNFMNIRPLRYSLVLDPHPDTLPYVSSYNPKRNLKLRDAVLSSYHPNEVKYSELTLDTYRMLQSLEWEPSGAFYHSGSGASQDGTTKNSGSNHTQDITDPTLPRNPRKAVLYRPSVTHFIAVLATACDELPADGVLFIYLSGKSGPIFSPSSGAGSRLGPESSVKILQSQTTLLATSMTDGQSPLCGQSEEVLLNSPLDCIHIGCRGNEGSSYIYPSDLLPFTRRPLFIVIDSESSGSFKIISGSEKGEPAAMILSPKSSPSTSAGEWPRHLNGSLFTIFLTAPIQAFCLLLGSSGSDIQTDVYDTADKLLSSSLNDWGLTLATSSSLDPVWSQVFCDPFLRRLLLRFIFCRAVLALYAPAHEKAEFIPQCLPSLPEYVHPSSPAIQSTILQIANVFDARSSFIFSEDLVPQENSHNSQE